MQEKTLVIINIIHLTLLLICLFICASTDLISGKIYNRILIVIIIIGALLDFFHYVLWNPGIAILFCYNSLAVILIALILYFIKAWAGGDTKLLCTIAILYPAEFYWIYQNAAFPFCFIVSLIFACGLIYVIFDSCIKYCHAPTLPSLQQIVQFFKTACIRYFKSANYLAASYHIYIQLPVLHRNIPPIIYSMLTFFIVSVFLSKVKLSSSMILILITVVFNIAMVLLTKSTVIRTFSKSLIVAFAVQVLQLFTAQYNYALVPTDSVSAGMILSRVAILKLSQSSVRGLPQKSDETLKSKLTKSEAESIHRWKNSKYGEKHILIVRKIPFAIFMLLGTILYFLIGLVLR